MKLEQRILSNKIECRDADSPEAPAVISGYAARFNEPTDMGWYREQVDPGAFSEADMSDVVALFNHDQNMVMSRTGAPEGLTLAVDSQGLRYEFKAVNECAKECAENIKLGFISKSSYSYYVTSAKWEDVIGEDGQKYELRTILKISKVQDVAPVTFPAYSTTSVEARSFDDERQKPADAPEPKQDLIDIKIQLRKKNK